MSFVKGNRTRKNLLFVDDMVPHFDMAAGARTSYLYLRLLVGMGINVTFLGADFQRVAPYTDELKRLGIKTLDGRWYRRFWKIWLLLNLRRFDYVYCNRPAPTMMLVDLFKRFGRAKILYQCHDLHYLRWQRSYMYDGDVESLRKAEMFEKIEREIFRKADILLAFSEHEKRVILEDHVDKLVEVVPLFFYRDSSPPIEDFTDRSGCMFVGGFNHTPNVDAVMWFVHEIFPRIVALVPEMVFYIAGSNPPPQILSLESPNIRILGFLDDNDLKNLYKVTRLVVVPLRFGAGVKGKVIEAIHYKVPVVSTAIGLEGIPGIGTCLASVNDEKAFGDQVVALYRDPGALRDMSKSLHDYAERHLSESVTRARLHDLLQIEA